MTHDVLMTDAGTPDHGQTAPDAGQQMQHRIEDLLGQARIDQDLISVLQSQGVFDRALIDALRRGLTQDQNQIANLEQALTTAREIGTAIGILMARHRTTADAAFAMLSAYSQTRNRKIRDIAGEIIETGALT